MVGKGLYELLEEGISFERCLDIAEVQNQLDEAEGEKQKAMLEVFTSAGGR